MAPLPNLVAAKKYVPSRALTKEELALTQPYFGLGTPPNRSHGILLIHGFTSTPATLFYLREKFVSLGYTVSSPLLAGHGKKPEDLIYTSWQDWLSEVEKAYAKLAQHCTKIDVIGHSLGGVLALQLAAALSKQTHSALQSLFLINPAVFPIPLLDLLGRTGVLFLLNSLHIQWLPFCRINANIKKANAREIVYSRIPVHAYLELYRCMLSTQTLLGQLKVPVTIFQSHKDAVVPVKRTQEILNRLGSKQKEIIWYKNSYHVIPIDEDAPDLLAQILKRIFLSSGSY